MVKRQLIHHTITESRVMDAINRRATTLDNPGFCLTCGAEHMACEPDARRYECESCGEKTVYADEELMLLSWYHPNKRIANDKA